jgi:hypothetical protein
LGRSIVHVGEFLVGVGFSGGFGRIALQDTNVTIKSQPSAMNELIDFP